MTLYKRREYFLVLPTGKSAHHFQAPTPEAAQAKAQAVATKHQVEAWTLGRDSEATYTFEFVFQGRTYSRDTLQRDQRSAAEYARRYQQEVRAGRLETLRALQLRSTEPELTLGQIIESFEKFATVEGLAPATIRGYKNAMRILIKGATGDASKMESLPISSLTPGLVYQYKAHVSQLDPKEDDARHRQLEGTANSVLRQAKGYFSARAMEHYRIVSGFNLPANVGPFRDAPGFSDTAVKEYKLPSDKVLEETFTQLKVKQTEDPELFVAVWLALGFGLRKSEIATIRAGWFQITPNGVILELRSTLISGSIAEKEKTKNGTIWPTVSCTNGAWAHLRPIVATLKPEDYLIQSPTATARCEEVFRRVGVWMQSIGWQTHKQIHEFRAYAGCQVARRDGIEAASRWLRHASITVTQRHYGRYLRPVVTDAPLVIPTSKAFEPKIVGG